MATTEGYELGWDSEISNDGPEYVILPNGDYDFEVTSLERGRYNGSDKLPACNMVIVNIKIEGAMGISLIKHRLYLHSKTEGLLCAFFSSIGLRKKGEKLVMNWNKVIGSKGHAKVGVRKWTSNKDGQEYESNEVTKFYEPETPPKTPAAQSFEPGRF